MRPNERSECRAKRDNALRLERSESQIYFRGQKNNKQTVNQMCTVYNVYILKNICVKLRNNQYA